MLRAYQPTPPDLAILVDAMHSEPAFGDSGSVRGSTDSPDEWRLQPGREVRHYSGVGLDVKEYVRRFVIRNMPPVQTAVRMHTSPLDLPASLGYLDTVWRLVHGKDNHLVVLPSPERAAALAFDVGTREEFLERLSALGDVLKCLAIPKGGEQQGGHSLQRMRAYLAWKLPSQSQKRLSDALDTLGYVVQIRTAGAHAAAEPDAVLAYSAVGIALPIIEWSSAWERVRSSTIEAFNAIREEIMSNLDDPGSVCDGGSVTR